MSKWHCSHNATITCIQIVAQMCSEDYYIKSGVKESTLETWKEQSHCYVMSETYGFPPVSSQNVCTENWSLTEHEVLLYITQMEKKKISGVHAE